jgi:hypothetical protein
MVDEKVQNSPLVVACPRCRKTGKITGSFNTNPMEPQWGAVERWEETCPVCGGSGDVAGNYPECRDRLKQWLREKKTWSRQVDQCKRFEVRSSLPDRIEGTFFRHITPFSALLGAPLAILIWKAGWRIDGLLTTVVLWIVTAVFVAICSALAAGAIVVSVSLSLKIVLALLAPLEIIRCTPLVCCF